MKIFLTNTRNLLLIGTVHCLLNTCGWGIIFDDEVVYLVGLPISDGKGVMGGGVLEQN